MGKGLDDYLTDMYEYTAKASEVNRQLAFVGIAVIWILKNPDGCPLLFPDGIVFSLVCLIASLGLDLIQYLAGAINSLILFNILEKKVQLGKLKDNGNILSPTWFSNYISTPLFFLKILATLIAYIKLFNFLSPKIFG